MRTPPEVTNDTPYSFRSNILLTTFPDVVNPISKLIPQPSFSIIILFLNKLFTPAPWSDHIP